MTISLIIPTHNKADYLRLVLASLVRQTVTPDEIVVVSDGSTDDTPQVLRRYGEVLPLVVVHQSQGGRAAARNAGLRKASGDLVIFCDDDRIAAPNFVEQHRRAINLNPLAVCVGWKKRALTIWRDFLPLHSLEYEQIRRTAQFSFPHFDHADQMQIVVSEDMLENQFDKFLNKWVIGDEFDNRSENIAEGSPLAWISGTTANLSFSRKGAEGVFFDEQYSGWGAEDVDFCLSLVNSGREILFLDEAINYHQIHPLGAMGLRNARRERMQQAQANLNRFCEKHRSIEAHLFRRIQQGMKCDTAITILQQVRSEATGQLEEELRSIYAHQTFRNEPSGLLEFVSGNQLSDDHVLEFVWDDQAYQSRPVPVTQQSNGRVRPAVPRITGAFSKPPVTHKWWTPMLWQADETKFCDNMFPLPLSLKAYPRGIGIGYPRESRITPDNRTFEFPFSEDIVLSYADKEAPLAFGVEGYSDWMVDASWSGGEAQLHMRAIQGCPTVHFWGEKSPILDLAVKDPKNIEYMFDDRAILVSVTGATYLICFDGCSASGAGEEGIRFDPIEPTFEIAIHLLPDDSPQHIARFFRQGTRKPDESHFSWVVSREGGEVELTYSLHSSGGGVEPNACFLQALYPHQWRNAAGLARLGEYPSARGAMVLVEAQSFSVVFQRKGFLPSLPIYDDQAELLRLFDDMVSSASPSALWQRPLEGTSLDDGYWAGKSLVRLADLLNIAREIGHVRAADLLSGIIKSKLELYFADPTDAGFYYNADWATTLYSPSDAHGLVELMNDHGYTYGYYLRAAVAVGLYDRAWLSRPVVRKWLMSIMGDVANPDRNNLEFPFLRCFDVFAGFSWGSGNGAYALGLNAEPSGESINFAAAVSLLGALWGDRDIEDFGIALYASETETALDYWFNRHDDSFPANFQLPFVGMLWSSGASHQSWWEAFSTETLGGNLIPMQASSIYLCRNPRLQDALDCVYSDWKRESPRWGGLFAMLQALIDPESAEGLLARLSDEQVREWSLHPITVRQWIRTMAGLGRPVEDISCNLSFYNVFEESGSRHYWAFNPGLQCVDAVFSDGEQFEIEPGMMQGKQVLTLSAVSTNGTDLRL